MFIKLQPYRQVSLATRSSQKLAPRFYGPYKVIAKVGKVAYKLELPQDCRIHPTFHVSLLKLCPDPNVQQRHPPDEWSTEVDVKEPERILQQRVGRRKKRIITEVLVQWKGCLEEEATWVTLHEFQRKYPRFIVPNP